MIFNIPIKNITEEEFRKINSIESKDVSIVDILLYIASDDILLSKIKSRIRDVRIAAKLYSKGLMHDKDGRLID